ncbi:MAG TPA: YceI family protein [Acidobacteria bacterium]|nr:YceI family protein [Acidobacteriota bacterium]
MSSSLNCRVPFIVVIVAAIAALTPAEAKTRDFTVLSGSSEVGFEGSSTLHDFVGRSDQVSGSVRFDPQQPASGATGHIEVRAASLDTDNRGRNKQMYKRLETDRFPLITFDLEAFELSARGDGGSLSGVARGVISIHGIGRPLAMDVTLLPLAGDGWKVEGRSEVEMPAFSIEPPRVLGLIKVAPKVTIFVALRLEPRR